MIKPTVVVNIQDALDYLRAVPDSDTVNRVEYFKAIDLLDEAARRLNVVSGKLAGLEVKYEESAKGVKFI